MSESIVSSHSASANKGSEKNWSMICERASAMRGPEDMCSVPPPGVKQWPSWQASYCNIDDQLDVNSRAVSAAASVAATTLGTSSDMGSSRGCAPRQPER